MNIEVEKLIKFKLPIDAYLVLHCLHNQEGEFLKNYVLNVKKIDTSVFKNLIRDGWLKSTSTNDTFTLENIEITNRFANEILKVPNSKNISFDVAFEQLRDHYPTQAGKTGRRLQGDIARCKRLYSNTIMSNGIINEELHSTILQCINFEIKIRTNKGSLDYFQMLATWLQQKTWELYVKDVEQQIKKDGFVSGDTNGFTTDI